MAEVEPIYVPQHTVVSLYLVTYNYRHLLYVLIIQLNSSRRYKPMSTCSAA